MESNAVERGPNIELREVSLEDEETMRQIASLTTKHIWFEGYPVDPMSELRQADYIVGAYEGNTLVGFGTIDRVASPDGEGNGEWWFGNALTLPEKQKKGIYGKIYQARLAWLIGKPGRLFCCVETEDMDEILLHYGWHKIRDTKDEEGGDCRVYEFPRT